jgi:O-antigen biosynthesis protein WbqP
MYLALKRLFDLFAALLAGVILSIPLLIITCIIRLTSKGPALHWSKRIGINNAIFMMAKFRTMRIDTPQVATHLLLNPQHYVTPIGKFLRKFSLDELPQIYNIIKGDLSFVGPRPALFNQDDLKQLRTQKGIHRLKPGLTGWAQINGRDELPIPVKVEFDEYYLEHRSFWFDIKIIIMTIFKAAQSEGVSH